MDHVCLLATNIQGTLKCSFVKADKSSEKRLVMTVMYQGISEIQDFKVYSYCSGL